MKKKLLCLLGASMMLVSLAACGKGNEPTSKPASSADSSSILKEEFQVAFVVDGERYKTVMVEEGSKITDTILTPTKEGYKFVGWYDGDNLVDLSTYVVTKAVTLTARFEEEQAGNVLSVDDKKEAGKSYYLVLGWWEVNDPAEPDKVTSHLTKQTVRLFYQNIINYLKAAGATDANIANIQFRNYSTATVAEMGALINADGDVDLMIGVGNNINSTAGVALYESSNDYKFQTPMGDGTQRYVACLSTATELGVNTYKWLKNTDAGVASFMRELTAAEITASLVPVSLDFTVRVHGDTLATTVLVDKDSVVTMPEITVPEDKNFKGFALTDGGEVVLNVAKNATLKYDDLKDLVAAGVKEIDLYPVLEAKPVVTDDLIVYIQVNGSNLTLPEAKLLEARFNTTLTNEVVKFNVIDGNATTFTNGIGNDADVIIGGNNPVNNFAKHADGPTANAGAKHFANTSRKVIISDKVATSHLTLAKKLYDFVIADAIEYEFHYSFWSNGNKWTTEAERTAMTTGIEAQANAYLGITGDDTLLSKYNVKVTSYVASGTKVADLGTETKGLRDGKGTDMVIGCGNNINATEGTTAGMTIVEKKELGAPFVAATGRYVALVHENPIARSVYETYFTVAA